MELSKRVIEELEKLVSQGPHEVAAVFLDSAQPQAYIVGVPAGEQEPHVALTLQDYDRYSVALRQLEVSYNELPTNDPAATADYLRHCAEEIIRRLVYLEGPLALLELDPNEGLAQLRSDPRQDGDETIYWEALVRAKPRLKVNLTRYHWLPGYHERESLVYPITLATLGRLAQDLALSLSAK